MSQSTRAGRTIGRMAEVAALGLALSLLSGVPGRAQPEKMPQLGSAQQTTPLSPSPSSRQSAQPASPADAPGPPFGVGPSPMRLEKMREEERHKRLQADTTKLVELTNELKTAVDKAGKNELSVDVVKKAAEIEKLARDVKERMRS